MPSHHVVVLVALVAVLAGCGGTTGTDATPTTPTEHPWYGETLVVALEAPDGEYDRYEPLLREALSYWEEESPRYAFPVAFEVRPNASDSDINVQIVDRIYECGNEDHTAGCTLQPVRPEAIPETVEFEVRRDLSAASTVAVMKHELGHILGLDHGDRPRGVMAAELSGSVHDRPDASERAVPWNGETLRVAVDVANVSAANRSQVRTQVDHTLAYYDRGADGTVPANLSFERVDAGTDADVRVTVRDTSSCETGRPVCVTLDGTDVDGDDALERYTALTVTVGGVESDVVGWYVARGLAPGLGLQADDLPPPLSDASAADRRRAWWD